MSSAALVGRIAQALTDDPLEPAPVPPWVADAVPGRDRPIVAWRHAIDDLAWTRGVDVVPAPGGGALSVGLLVVDAGAQRADAAFDPASDPRAAVLLALAERCATTEIALRVAMLPPWLIEGPLGSAARRAARSAEAQALRACPLPPAGPWWEAFDAGSLRVLSWIGPVRLLPAPAKAADPSQVGPVPLEALVWGEGAGCWAQPDPAAARLEVSPAPRRFGTACLPAEAIVPPGPATRTPVPLVPKRTAFRTGRGGRRCYLLGRPPRRGGWLKEERRVRALLVGSSGSRALVSLLEKALAEIGHGEARAEHVSRGEHLKRASHVGGAVVLLTEDWRDWLRLAEA